MPATFRFFRVLGCIPHFSSQEEKGATEGPGADGGPLGGGEAGGMSMATLGGVLCGCISRYMALFSAKLCCFTDLRPHLVLFVMAGEKRRWLYIFARRVCRSMHALCTPRLILFSHRSTLSDCDHG